MTYAIDRFSRDTIDVLNTVLFMRQYGITIINLRKGFDFNTPIGKAMLSALAEIERSNIREKPMAIIRRAKAEDRHLDRTIKADSTEIKQWSEENSVCISKQHSNLEYTNRP